MKFITSKFLFFTILAISAFTFAFAQPKAEIRGVWLTTNSGMDWPKGTYSEAGQKSSLIQILDKLEAININTIVLQVQVSGDVLWKSKIQPSIISFTGSGSRNLTWDPCKFVIEECHKRNMECHAWIVPYRIGKQRTQDNYKNNTYKHVSATHPELCVTYKNAFYLDPGLPEVRKYLLDLYRELITNYDFDGTNFDYTRYPGKDFDDSESYRKYGNGKNKNDWRRENINTFVHEFYDMAKSIRPDIKVGSAPIGTYKNISSTHNMSAYADVFQDACEWAQAEKQDLLIPQMYWNEKYGFSKHLGVWTENANGRNLVSGLAPYKMEDGTNNWDVTEVTSQIEKVRNAGWQGVCFFRTDHVIGNSSKVKALYNQLKNNYFKYPAHIPTMDYNGVTTPDAPQNVDFEKEGNSTVVTWDTPSNSQVKYYCVYYAPNGDTDVKNIAHCVGFAVKGNSFTFTCSESNPKILVTAFDKNYYESEAATAKFSGVEDINANNIAILNNESEITATGADVQSMELFSISGTSVANVKGNSIEATDLSHGIYLLKVNYTNGETSTHKIMH